MYQTTYEPSAPTDPYEHPITSAPANQGTAMNDDMLVINDANELPATAFAPTKWAKLHPESDYDSNQNVGDH